MVLTLTRQQVTQLFAHAQAVALAECCGLLGGVDDKVSSVYPLRNIAPDAQRAYEAAPAELFAAQRDMRERGETLLGIYHSHPRQAKPQPSLTDVRLAFYPSATYFIIGLSGETPVLRGFLLDAAAQTWQSVEYLTQGE